MAENTALDFIEQNGQKFIHVSTINTVEANTQFVQNVQVVQRQRQAVVELNQRAKTALTDAERTAALEKSKEIVKKLEENNQAMARAYGYSLARDYLHQILKTRIFLKLTDVEYAAAKDDAAVPAEQLLVKGDDKFRLIAEIPGAEANTQFRHNVQVMHHLRQQLVALNESIKKMPESEEKAKALENVKTAEENLIKNNDLMIKQYGFSLARDYLMEIVESKLYTKVNEEEFLAAQKKASEAAAQ